MLEFDNIRLELESYEVPVAELKDDAGAAVADAGLGRYIGKR